MACCGKDFAIGDRVVWPVSPNRIIDDYLPPEVEEELGVIDYSYDKHSSESWDSLLTLTGKVKRIRGVFLRFGPRPGTEYLYPASGFVVEMPDSDFHALGLPREKPKGEIRPATANAYVVELEDWEIRPAERDDDWE